MWVGLAPDSSVSVIHQVTDTPLSGASPSHIWPVQVSGFGHQLLATLQHQPRTAALAGADVQLEAVQVDARRHHRQTRPEPALLVAFSHAIKTLEHRLAFRGGDAGAGVVDFDTRAARIVDPAQNHFAARWGELDR